MKNVQIGGQAKKGGEQGINGFWYKGGQFLPTSETTVKGQYTVTIKKGTKSEIAPYTWAEAPADDMLSIYDRINHLCADNRRECQYIKGQGFVGFKFTEILREFRGMDKNENYIYEMPSAERQAYLQALMDKFNSGERWFPLAEDPYHYKNNQK